VSAGAQSGVPSDVLGSTLTPYRGAAQLAIDKIVVVHFVSPPTLDVMCQKWQNGQR